VVWIDLAQDRDQHRVIVSAKIKHKEFLKCLNSLPAITLSRTQLHGVDD
jgi:hypothetical protein